MKKKTPFILIGLIIFGLGLWVFWRYFESGNSNKIGGQFTREQLSPQKISPSPSKELIKELEKMPITKLTLFDIREQVGFGPLHQALLTRKNYTLLGGLIYFESGKYLKGIEVNNDDYRAQYQFILDKTSRDKANILKNSYELAREVFKIELKIDREKAKKSLAYLQKNFQGELLNDDECYQLQLAITLKEKISKIQSLHQSCLNRGKHTSTTFSVVEYMLETGLASQIKAFYLPLQKKYTPELPDYSELAEIYTIKE